MGFRGIPAYIAPEVWFFGDKAKNPATDVYAFGVLAMTVKSGEAPYKAMNDAQIVVRVVDGKRPSRPLIMSGAMWNIVELCWHQRSAKRCSSMALVAALADLLIDYQPS